jgi:hypothetical protein
VFSVDTGERATVNIIGTATGGLGGAASVQGKGFSLIDLTFASRVGTNAISGYKVSRIQKTQK